MHCCRQDGGRDCESIKLKDQRVSGTKLKRVFERRHGKRGQHVQRLGLTVDSQQLGEIEFVRTTRTEACKSCRKQQWIEHSCEAATHRVDYI